jgi:hypothetical protein
MNEKTTHGDERTLTEGINPILIPEHSQEVIIETRFKDLNVQLIVLICVNTEIFNLVQRNGLIFGCSGTGRGVVFRISAEGPDIDFSSGNGTVWINLYMRRDLG